MAHGKFLLVVYIRKDAGVQEHGMGMLSVHLAWLRPADTVGVDNQMLKAPTRSLCNAVQVITWHTAAAMALAAGKAYPALMLHRPRQASAAVGAAVDRT